MVTLDKIFKIKYGTDLELINCEESMTGIPFISRTSSNNGMVARVKIKDDIELMPGHAISVALGGSVLSSFYQKTKFYTSFHISCLYPINVLSEVEMIYYCSVIEKNKYKYNYGRQANKTLKSIMVPSLNELPSFRQNYSLKIPFNKIPISKEIFPLNVNKWKWFKLGDLFNIKKGKRLTQEDYLEGSMPFIGSTELNNGITAFIGNDEYIHSSNVITVTYNGSIAEAFYQEKEFWASDDVNVLYPKFEMSNHIALFFCTIIAKEKYRFNYGRKWYAERMVESPIKLPAKFDGTPDYIFMEDYIKSLPYSRNI